MAYTNFTNCTKQEYWNIIYGSDKTNRIRIWFNNVELQDADEYCISLKQKDNILPTDGNKTFTLSNFISKELELVLRDLPEGTTIEDQVRISIGTLVDANNNTYEDVPLGVFNIQDTPTTDQNKVTIKLRDNRVKFDFKYNAQPLIDENAGTTTLGAILNDICTQAGVTNNVGRFKGEDIEVGTYDNTITGTTYVGYIAEQCGMIPKIDRNGALVFVNLMGEPENASITDTATLENITSYNIDDLELKGNTTQNGTPTPDTPIPIENVTGRQIINIVGQNYYNYTDTIDVNPLITTDGNGWITATYNNTGSSIVYLNYFTNNLPLEYDTNYGVFTEIKNVSGTGTIYISSTSNSYGQFSQTKYYEFSNLTSDTTKKDIIKTKMSTDTGNHSGLRTFLRFGAGQSGSITFRLSVIKDTSITTDDFKYEPYIEQINEINLKGKNLLSLTDGTYTFGGITAVVNNNVINLSGTSTTAYLEIPLTTPIKSDIGTLTKSLNPTGKYGGVTSMLMNRNYEIIGLTSTGGANATGTLSGNAYYFRIYIQSGITVDCTLEAQIEAGSQATSFSTYFEPIELNGIGNYKDRIFKSKGINLANDIFSDYDSSNASYSIYPIKLEQGATYTLNATLVGEQKTQYYNFGIVKDGDTYGTFVDLRTCVNYSNGTTGTITFTVDNTYTNPKLVCYIQQSETKFNELFTNYQIQLEKRSSATEYEPYGEPSWYIEKQIGKVILDGSETWNYSSGNTAFYIALPNGAKASNNNEVIVMSDYFKGDTANHAVSSSYNYIIGTNTLGYTWFRYNSFSSVSDFKTWLSTHNTIVYYVLSTPTYTKIENEELIDQLENIRLLTGLNNINSSVPLDFVYLKEKEHYRMPLSIVEKYELGTSFDIKRVVYESGIIKYETGTDEELSTLYLNSANPYVIANNQVNEVYSILNTLNIDSVKTGKILGNPALDSYDIIEVYDDEDENEPVIFRTFANNDLTYNGVNIQTFDTQISQEARKENVTSNSSETFQKYAKTLIDNVNAEVSIQAGQISDLNKSVSTFTTTASGFEFQISKLQTDVENIDTSKASKLVNSLVTIDDDGIHVKNDESTIQTDMTNESFQISTGGQILADFTYDDTKSQSYATMDNLTVNTYLIAGNHRIEKRGNRTYWYYIGGNQ